MKNSLVIDQGNTRLKTAVFSGNELIEFRYTTESGQSLVQDLIKEFDPESAIYSASGKIDPEIQNVLLDVPKYFELSTDLELPVNTQYDTPETLGDDRIANVCGAIAQYPNENCLVVDIGTCITYDFIDSEKNYLGGAISPGPFLRTKSMNDYTARLPIVETEAINHLIGKTTSDSLTSGVMNGILFEIEGYCERLISHYSALTIIFTGGYANIFVNDVKYSIFADPNLTLKGLNEILMLNAGQIS